MKIIPQSIEDIFLIEPNIFSDERGYFFEAFRQDKFEEVVGYKVNFCQDNESKSNIGVVRGLHYQLPPYSQAKLVRVVEGSVLDVAVDIRKSSPTFGDHVSVELTSDNKNQLFIPHGFAHGFAVLSSSATFAYKVDNYYSSEHERGIAFNDKDLRINWKISSEDLKISNKDCNHPTLADSIELFE